VEYDAAHDLIAVWRTRAARTETTTPGAHAHFDRDERLVGIQVLDARTALGNDFKIQCALAAAS
ncbi:MAG: hypothetical protein ACRDG3_05435, partial [Tepidiformaceae bacterium]